MTSKELKIIAAATTSGALLFPMIGVIAGASVPIAMSTFGTIVAGVGTIHTPLASLGCAAILQSVSASLVSTTGVITGALTGAITGKIVNKLQKE
jgi:hypothetical protein